MTAHSDGFPSRHASHAKACKVLPGFVNSVTLAQVRKDILKPIPTFFRESLWCHDNERIRRIPSPFGDHFRNPVLQNTLQDTLIFGTVTDLPTTVKENDYRIVLVMGVIAPW